jgi:hypothetical protein
MVRTKVGALYGCVAAAGVLALTLGSARAQDVSARDRQSAAEAYDRGTAAYLSRDYERAAQWFETAHRLAPAPAALIQAVRAHERAGSALRTASLGLQLQALYPEDAGAQRAAERALRNARRFVRVDVECTECTVQVDGSVVDHTSFFVAPGEPHVVEAAFPTGARTETVEGAAGTQHALRFDAPPPPEVVPEPVEVTPPDPIVVEPPVTSGGGGGVPLAVTITSLVIAAGLGGVLVWSGVDTLDGVPAYEMMPTPEGLADGRSREERTNWLIAGTSAAAALTLVLAIFTDWGGGEASEARVERALIGIDRDGVVLGVGGRL